MYQSFRVIVACIVVLLVSVSAFPQGIGTLNGTVTDSSGLAVPNCKVTALMVEQQVARTTKTNSEGYYLFPTIPIGTYNISVEAPGFKAYTRIGVAVHTADHVSVDVSLEVGNVNQSVTVSAQAPLVDTTSSTLGTLIDDRRIVDLPLNGRNVLSLVSLLPAAASVSVSQTFTGYASGPTMSISGSKTNENLNLFDGLEFNQIYRNTGLNYPPPDAIQEVKVLTNGFSAEYGRNGGSVIDVVTKSGTNHVHGSAWEFIRNNDLNAKNYFQSGANAQLIQNQFGAAAGGPVLKDKLFIFGAYEGLRIRPQTLLVGTFPLTAAERAGNFAGEAPIMDPTTGQQFPGNVIPTNRLDPVAVNVVSTSLMPLPNGPNGEYISSYGTPSNNDNVTARVDFYHGRHTVTGRYNYNHALAVLAEGSIPTFMPATSRLSTHNIALSDLIAIRPNLLVEFRGGYSAQLPINSTSDPHTIQSLGSNFPVLPDQPAVSPEMNIVGRVQMGAVGVYYQIPDKTWQFSPSVQWTRGAHSIKAGGELLVRRIHSHSYSNEGLWTFTGTFTGNPAADFMLGRAATLSFQDPATSIVGTQFNNYYYFQDDWRIQPRLTLNLGLRYEVLPPWANGHGWREIFKAGAKSVVFPTAPVGMLFTGDPGVSKRAYRWDNTNFAPRVGFAWDVSGNGRTVVRGAAGIFYESPNADLILGQSNFPYQGSYSYNAPVSLVNPLQGQVPPVLGGFNLTNPVFPVGLQVLWVDPNLHTPYIDQFNFNVQRQVTQDFMVQVAYVGRLSRREYSGLDTNAAVYGPGATLANTNSRRLYPLYGENFIVTDPFNGSYHSLQIQANKRFSRGFSLQGAYAYGKALDVTSIISDGNVVPNPNNLQAEYGRSDYDETHITSLSGIWDIPTVTRDVVSRAILGGWSLSGFVTMNSGSPINVLLGSDVALSGTPNQRPNAIGNPALPTNRPLSQRINAWFNRSAFVAPTAGTYGDVSRNSLVGPGSATANATVLRNFSLPPFREPFMHFQFRAEFFNLFNRVNLGNPTASLASGC